MTTEASEPVYRQVGDASEPDLLRTVHEQLLTHAFGPDELLTVDELNAVLDGPGRHELVVQELAGRPVGVGFWGVEPDARLGLLWYLAVDGQVRGRGLGSKLMTHLRQRWDTADIDAVLAEVHDPRCHPDSEHERATDRLTFYRRSGARLIDAAWVQPAVRPGTARVPGMLLLTVHPTGDQTPEDVAAVDLAQWVEGAYASEAEEIDRLSARLDEQYRAVRGALDGRTTVRTLDIDDYRQVTPIC
jgi:GNAT superfamily N-acetyltransferase